MKKRYTQALQLIDKNKVYSIEEAISLAKKTSTVKFDAAIEAHFHLNVDTKKTDQKVRTQVLLPHGNGKSVRVAAFVSPGREKEAKDAGAEVIGADDLIKKIKDTGKIDFDIAIAETQVMKSLAQIAKILGQKGVMPNPKTGTVGDDIAKMVHEAKSGKVDAKTDDSGNIHLSIGKTSFDSEKLKENYEIVKEAIAKARPSGVKKEFIAKITIASSMGPGIMVTT